MAVARHSTYITCMCTIHYAAIPIHWPITPRACAVKWVNNSRSIWEIIDTHGYGKILLQAILNVNIPYCTSHGGSKEHAVQYIH